MLTAVDLGRPRVGFFAALAARRALAEAPAERAGRPRFGTGVASGSSSSSSSSGSASAALRLPVLRPALFGAAALLVERGVLDAADLAAGVAEAESDGRPRFLKVDEGAEMGKFASSSSSASMSMSASGIPGGSSFSVTTVGHATSASKS
jgi:hypothetical protein